MNATISILSQSLLFVLWPDIEVLCSALGSHLVNLGNHAVLGIKPKAPACKACPQPFKSSSWAPYNNLSGTIMIHPRQWVWTREPAKH